MAITVLNEPDLFRPLYHAVYFRLDSTIKASTSMKYVYKITVGSSTRKIKVAPEPVNGYGILDAKNLLKDFINDDLFDITDADFQDSTRVEYQVSIDEEYIDGSGNLITNVDEFVFGTKIAYNTRFSRDELFGNLNAYPVDTATPGKLLLNIKPDTTVFDDDVFYIHFIGNTTAPFKPLRLEIRELDQSSNLLATTLISGDLDTNSQLVTMDLSQITFNALTRFISFRLIDTDSNPTSESIRLKLRPRECSTFNETKLIYLDAKGSYNSLNFDGARSRQVSMKSKSFRKFVDPLTDNGQARGIQKYFLDSTEVITINTFITEDSHNLMFEDLMKSNRVFVDLRNNPDFENIDFAPIEILERRFKPMETVNGQLPQYEIDIRYAYEEVNRL